LRPPISEIAYNSQRSFYKKGKLHFIYGNHDMVKKYDRLLERSLYHHINELDKSRISLFENIKVHEGLVLKHNVTNKKIFLIHGHQVDFLIIKCGECIDF